MQRKKKGKYVVFSLVFLVFGFIIAFSYSQSSKEDANSHKITDRQYVMQNNLRKQIILAQDKNRELQKDLNEKQISVRNYEKDLSKEEEMFSGLAEDAEKYRMFLGKMKVKGSGIEVSLEDGEYNQSEDANNYIVHEHHVFKVVNELYIAGASAISINGQRLNHNSYIYCNGPVITVDGNPYPAPFKIVAIGDPNNLISALNISGGVRDQIVNDNIIFSIEKKKQILFEPVLGESS
ncbi:DUF881 domain-containing protein [Lederbergia panacisoli]|uniref:DUF881 domain-containing protein n=1 Tax=Lederbergia panacisoli TaxID=1255251 RepID=UPI00214CFC39|nr:DUF881 domain-containing protein [Lederbergia panacisoli]MCR2820807.1 DUF881 domain-containing protein [Lederbergia panacisoli]